MNKKVIFFDMDGLLIDSERIHINMWNDAFKESGLTYNKELLYSTLGVTSNKAQEICAQMGYNINLFSNLLPLKNKLMKSYLETNGMPVKKGAVNLLNYLDNKNIDRVIVSSSDLNIIINYLELANIKHYFNKIVSGEFVVKSKPMPDIYEEAMKLFSYQREDCLVLEDSINGLLAADAAGIDVIGIPDLIDLNHLILPNMLCLLENLDEVLKYIIDNELFSS